MARNPERDFGAAREHIDRSEWRAALGSLDRARKAYVKRHDRYGLEHVLQLIELVDAEDDAARSSRENLEYAVKQNLRQTSRIEADRTGARWMDPHPDLESPRQHTGIYISRIVKIWIGVGVLLGGLLAAFWLVGIVGAFLDLFGGKTLALQFENNRKHAVVLKWCNTVACNGDMEPLDQQQLDPGTGTEEDMAIDDVVDLFVVYDRRGHRLGCLPVRIDRTYSRLHNKSLEVVVKISQMTPCPGTIVSPRLP